MEMNLVKPSSREAENVVEESVPFDKSLMELRELRSQLHSAAEHCETTFLKSKDKSEVLENTKEYICRTVVTVVDHLGNVSANLEGLISHTNAFSEADLRIQCLKQRLFSCEQYAHRVALTKLLWSENLPRFHSRYLSSTAPTLERSSKEKLRDSESRNPAETDKKNVLETHENLPLFMYTHKPCSANSLKQATTTVVPVEDGLSVLTKVANPFHFQRNHKVGRSPRRSDILRRMRRSKRSH